MFGQSRSERLADITIATTSAAVDRQMHQHFQLTTYLIGVLAASVSAAALVLNELEFARRPTFYYAWEGALVSFLATSLLVWRALLVPAPNAAVPKGANAGEAERLIDFKLRLADGLRRAASQNEARHAQRVRATYSGHAWLSSGLFLITVALATTQSFMQAIPGIVIFLIASVIAFGFAQAVHRFAENRVLGWRRAWIAPIIAISFFGLAPALLGYFAPNVLRALPEELAVVLAIATYGFVVAFSLANGARRRFKYQRS